MRLSVFDLRGAVRLVVRAVTGVADLVEATHATVTRPFGRPRRTRGVAGWTYRAVRGGARGVGRALDLGLSAADRRRVDDLTARPAGGAGREAAVAALNGVLGDALAAEANPLATPTQVRWAGRRLALDADAIARDVDDPSGVLVVLVHGLCMHEGQWGDGDHDPGAALAAGLGATCLGLRYNSGRHISESGHDAAGVLDRLVAAWPRPVRRLVIVGHSMGGLVARSALAVAAEAGHGWLGRDVALVTLGSPHHGAPLERIGNGLDGLLGATRWTAPYARIGQVRSAGVTDLRFGSVHADDRAGRDRFARGPDRRRHVPLPDGVACHLVAATTGDGRGGLRDRTVGDGLVPLDSALGRHADPARTLAVRPDRQWVAVGMTHLDLVRRPEVTAKLLEWLARPAPGG